ncbi:MAG: DUF1579 family protein [Planctomycetota bacterium]|nr:DUF1579 family protein [Planctomycetota bacterium]
MRIYLTAAAVLLAGSAAFAAVSSYAVQAPAAPAAQHKHLHEGIGTFEGVVTMLAPGMEGQTNTAKEVITAHGPFFLKSDFTMPMGPGMNYEGHGVFGYSVASGKYTGTWIGNTEDHLAIMEGDYNEKTGVMTMRWMAPNMMTKKLTQHHSETTRTKDAYTMTFFEEGTPIWKMEMKRTSKPVEASANEADKDK